MQGRRVSVCSWFSVVREGEESEWPRPGMMPTELVRVCRSASEVDERPSPGMLDTPDLLRSWRAPRSAKEVDELGCEDRYCSFLAKEVDELGCEDRYCSFLAKAEVGLLAKSDEDERCRERGAIRRSCTVTMEATSVAEAGVTKRMERG